MLVKIPGSPQANAYPVEDIRSLDKEEVKKWKEQQAEQQREAEERWKKRQERKDHRGGASSKSAKPSKPKPDEKPSGSGYTRDESQAGR